MHSATNRLLKNLSLGREIRRFSTFLFVTMAAPCSFGSQHARTVVCSSRIPAVSVCKGAIIRASGGQGSGTKAVSVCQPKQTVVCTTIKPSYYVCPAGQNCTLSLCAAVYGRKKQKTDTESLHPYSIDQTHHLPEKDSQKQAVHFVAQQWSSYPKGHHYHSVPSDEMMALEQAYIDKFFTPCGDDGRLTNTAPFTLTQVYVAYYMALAAIESLADLAHYEHQEIDEKIEKKKAEALQTAMQAIMQQAPAQAAPDTAPAA